MSEILSVSENDMKISLEKFEPGASLGKDTRALINVKVQETYGTTYSELENVMTSWPENNGKVMKRVVTFVEGKFHTYCKRAFYLFLEYNTQYKYSFLSC